VPVLSALALALSACGSGGHAATVPSLSGSSNAPASAPSGALVAARAAVACARKHGMPNVPDPVLDANGKVTIPGGAPTPTPAVRSACAQQLSAVQGQSSTHPIESAADIQALDRFAACMRAHDLPRWPDPNEHGEFHVKSADAGTREVANRAGAACDPLVPPSGAWITVTPTGQ
jgi:hypothetical protein